MQTGDVYQQRVQIIGQSAPGPTLAWDIQVLTGAGKGTRFAAPEQYVSYYYESMGSSREGNDSPPLAALRVIRDAPPGTMASQLRQMAREALAGIE